MPSHSDLTRETLCGFVTDTVEPGAIVHTDGWTGYAPLARRTATSTGRDPSVPPNAREIRIP